MARARCVKEAREARRGGTTHSLAGRARTEGREARGRRLIRLLFFLCLPPFLRPPARTHRGSPLRPTLRRGFRAAHRVLSFALFERSPRLKLVNFTRRPSTLFFLRADPRAFFVSGLAVEKGRSRRNRVERATVLSSLSSHCADWYGGGGSHYQHAPRFLPHERLPERLIRA